MALQKNMIPFTGQDYSPVVGIHIYLWNPHRRVAFNLTFAQKKGGHKSIGSEMLH